MMMPEMNGRQLGEILLQRRPELKVLYVSGYTNDLFTRHGIKDATTAFLQKPFSAPLLAKKVREVLDAKS